MKCQVCRRNIKLVKGTTDRGDDYQTEIGHVWECVYRNIDTMNKKYVTQEEIEKAKRKIWGLSGKEKKDFMKEQMGSAQDFS